MTGKKQRPFRRRVFYIPGFDPHPARRYRELYRTQGAEQAAIAGYSLEQRDGKPESWTVAMNKNRTFSEAEISVLPWSDLVRGSMSGGLASIYGALCRTAWIYVRSGALRKISKLRKGPLITALFPAGVLLIFALIAFGAFLSIGILVEGMIGWALGVVVVFALTYLFRKFDRRIYATYLMQDYAYAAKDWGAYPTELEDRLRAFTDAIAQAGDVDEILIVGHSSGAFLAISALADLLRRGAPAGPAISLLTLGQVVPMVSLLPRAQRLRRDLSLLAAEEAMTWIDVTAPGDGCSFALTDPVSVSGATVANKRWPLVLSAAFSETLSQERLLALRYRFFRLHFQYLCAFDDPRRYDYFAITAGALTLAERFAGRRASPSLLDRSAA